MRQFKERASGGGALLSLFVIHCTRPAAAPTVFVTVEAWSCGIIQRENTMIMTLWPNKDARGAERWVTASGTL